MDAGPAKPMVCPRDGHALELKGDYADTQREHHCPVCEGVFVSPAALVEYARDIIAVQREYHLSPRHRYSCPRCRGAMASVTRDGAVMDFCESCDALWVDREQRAAWSLQSTDGSAGQGPSSGDLGRGAFYAREDYAGFFRRLVILAIDSLVLIVGSDP